MYTIRVVRSTKFLNREHNISGLTEKFQSNQKEVCYEQIFEKSGRDISVSTEMLVIPV
jgi:hypothetical protein